MVNLVPVNGGTILPSEYGFVEVLGPGYSTHPTNIVCLYTTEGRVKVECAYSGKDTFEVYRFKTHDELQHYWSRQLIADENNKKYGKMIRALKLEYARIFGQ